MSTANATIGYPVPEETFDAREYARNKVLRANQLQETILGGYKGAFEDFWGVQWPPKGSRHTTAEMQQIVNAIPQSVALDMLQDSQALREFINAASYPSSEYLFSPTILFPTGGNSHFWDANLAGS